jgi:hypothetical protein
MIRNKIVIVTLLAIGAAVAFPGCARWFSNHSAKRTAPITNRALFAVTSEHTSFYRYGPKQGHGPDRELPKDTVVTMIRHSFGYSKIRLEDGEQGFVANDDLIRAPERLIAQVTDTSNDEVSELPPTPTVRLPIADPSPEFEPTPLPQQLMPQ